MIFTIFIKHLSDGTAHSEENKGSNLVFPI